MTAERKFDHEYTGEIVCPYCGYEFSDSWEIRLDDEEIKETDCYQCLKVFSVTKHVSVKYSTEKKK